MVFHLVKCLFFVFTFTLFFSNVLAQQSIAAIVLNLETNLTEENVSVRFKDSGNGAIP